MFEEEYDEEEEDEKTDMNTLDADMNIFHALSIFLVVLTLILFVLQVVSIFDVQVIHYEDGSGELTYCIPLTPCWR